MIIGDHVTHAFGLPVKNYIIEQAIVEPAAWAYRFSVAPYGKEDIPWNQKFAAFLLDPLAAEVTTIVVGFWDSEWSREEADVVVTTLCGAREQLPDLKAIFLGDITCDECEISWIQQTDVSPLFAAYPHLQHFRVRGGQGLRFETLHHNTLRTLIVEAGGLDRGVLHQLWRSKLPTLEHLELWLGTENYGGNATIEDLAPLLSGELFPNLHYLGLRNSEFEDDIATILTLSPLLERLQVLDLSLGTLGDEGAQALLDSPAILKLQTLDIHHNFCSPDMLTRLQSLPLKVDVSQEEMYNLELGQFRYIAVAE